MDKRNLAFLLVREHQANDSIGAGIKPAFGGVYVAKEHVTVAQSEEAITVGAADAVAFGVLARISPRRFEGRRSAKPMTGRSAIRTRVEANRVLEHPLFCPAPQPQAYFRVASIDVRSNPIAHPTTRPPLGRW